MTDNPDTVPELPQPDLGPLAWTVDELEKSMHAGMRAARRFAQDHAGVRESDVLAIDMAELRTAHGQFHQVAGVLEMIEMPLAARVARAMEAAANRFVRSPQECDEAAAGKLENGGFALVEYLADQLREAPRSALGMFPQYQEIQVLAGADRVHPADLWTMTWRWQELTLEAAATPVEVGPQARARMDRGVLEFMRSGSAEAASTLAQFGLDLAAGAQGAQVRIFWQYVAAFFEAAASGAFPVDAFVKRTASRVLLQYVALAGGNQALSERLLLDLLFFSWLAQDTQTPVLRAVREAWDFTGAPEVSYFTPVFGLYDPNILTKAKRGVEAGKQSWAALVDGDVSRLESSVGHLKTVAQALHRLNNDSQPLVSALMRIADQVMRGGRVPPSPVSMEVATALLYLEAMLAEFRPQDLERAARMQQLAARLEAVMQGAEAPPLEPWMQALYRHAGGRQTMGTVVGELRTTLGEVEAGLDHFFRNPEERIALEPVPGLMSQMRSVLSVLGLETAVTAVGRMRAQVEQLREHALGGDPTPPAALVARLGNSLGALGFLLDTLGYQPALARDLFVFDEVRDEFRFVSGRASGMLEEQAAEWAASVSGGFTVHDPGDLAAPGVAAEQATATGVVPHPSPEGLDQIATRAALEGRPAMAKAAARAARAAREQDEASLSDALETLRVTESLRAAPAGMDADQAEARDAADGDPELLDIFLEEASSVVADGLATISALTEQPDDTESLNTLRRAFHTLKGSARMVDLPDFSAAAWSMERLLNTWLSEHRSADHQLRTVAEQGLTALGRWANDLLRDADTIWSPEAFAQLADGLRLHGRHEQVVLDPDPVATAPDIAVPDALEDSASRPPATGAADESVPGKHDAAVSIGEPVAIQPVDLPELELSDFGLAEEVPTMAPEAGQELEVDLEIDLKAENSGFVITELPESDDELEPVISHTPAVPEGHVDVVFPDLALDEILLPPEEPHTVDDAARPADQVEEQPVEAPAFREIGGLRISTALYNVYLAEAEQWSADLASVMSAWTDESEAPVPERAVDLAHSLAGSSATVGFDELSELARAVEHALRRLQEQEDVPQTPEEVAVLAQAGDEVRSVLHQFAAGLLQAPNPELLARVQALRTELPPDPSFDVTSPDSLQGISAEILGDVTSAPEPRADEIAIELDIDKVDPDLFPIFEEEADELLPRLSALLRQWVASPGDISLRADVLRILHTLKGSARLVGAFDLGNRAHQLESMLEGFDGTQEESATLEDVQESVDSMQAEFEVLRDLAAPSNPATEPPATEPKPKAALELAAAETAAGEPVGVEAGPVAAPTVLTAVSGQAEERRTVRVALQLFDSLMAQLGELVVSRTRLEADVKQLRGSLTDLTGSVDRLRRHLHEVELQSEAQMQSRAVRSDPEHADFDPLELDRFTRMQEVTRMMAESVDDVATVHRSLQRALESSEDDLAAQMHQSRELQHDLLRMRMTEFDSIAERLHRTVRQASRESGKEVRLEIVGGEIEVDRSVLDRLVPAFDHLLRNCVVHGIETPQIRRDRGKDAVGQITIMLEQSGNDIALDFRDDGEGLDLEALRRQATQRGLLAAGGAEVDDTEIISLVFRPGVSTVGDVTELAGRGVGMDVVNSEVQGLGGRIETTTQVGEGTSFKLVIPATTAVTHVVLVRIGDWVIGVPSGMVQQVLHVPAATLTGSYESHGFAHEGQTLPFFWLGGLLQHSLRGTVKAGGTATVIICHSAAQRVALHVDEIIGDREVVIKPLGPQLSRLPGLVAITALASGAVTLIYNPVALASVYGEQIRRIAAGDGRADAAFPLGPQSASGSRDIPAVLVVDDSITVRRVLERLLERNGFRVMLAADGQQALEQLALERPAVMLSDIEMPRMDGFELLRRVRSDARTADLPVIMITSRTATKHRERARELGADQYLGKPYSDDELLQLVEGYAQAWIGTVWSTREI